MQNIILFTFIVLSFIASITVAVTPPACVLACINEEKNPTDLKAVCTSSDVSSCFDERCSNYKDEAVQSFQNTCKENGYDTAISYSSPSMVETASASSKASEASITRTAIFNNNLSISSGSLPTGSSTQANNTSKPTSPASPSETVLASNSGAHVAFSGLLLVVVVAVSSVML